jgi:hypothetical protein
MHSHIHTHSLSHSHTQTHTHTHPEGILSEEQAEQFKQDVLVKEKVPKDRMELYQDFLNRERTTYLVCMSVCVFICV